MADFEKNIEALMKGVEEHITTKTIVGEPIRFEDMTVFPLAEVSFGVAAGAFSQDKKNNGVGGVGGKVTPSAVLILQGNSSRIIDIRDKNSMNKIIEMIPDIVTKLADTFGPNKSVEPPAADIKETSEEI